MKAPDKIYIPGKWLHIPANHFETEPSYRCTEYIRKDALLEMFLYAQESAGGDYQKAVYQIAIDKLNTM